MSVNTDIVMHCNFGEFPRCPPSPFVKVAARPPPFPVVPDPLSRARPLGDGVGSGDLGDGSTSVW